MFALEELVCCGGNYYDEDPEKPCTTFVSYLPPMDHWSVFEDGEQSTPKEKHHEVAAYRAPEATSIQFWSTTGIPIKERRYPAKKALIIAVAYPRYPLFNSYRGRSLRNKLSVMDDWATALRSRHDMGVVHGKLTPEAVDVVNGRGILVDRGQWLDHGASWVRESADDEIDDARWTATEFFRLDNGDPRPTKMSDVYSFGCLMLQILTGSVPYCGTTRPEQVVYLKYLGRGPIDAQTPKIPDRYVAFMQACWSPEPEERPTMESVVGFIQGEIKGMGE